VNRARDAETGRIGTYETSLVIPNLNPDKVAPSALPISSVVLSSQRVELEDALFNATKDKDKNQVQQTVNPLVQEGQKLIPSVTRAQIEKLVADGVITEKRMKRARTSAQLEIEPAMSRFRRSEWHSAFGASGTMRSVADTLAAHGTPVGHITRDGIEWLLGECLKAGDTAKLKLPGLAQDRQDILPGGLAIMVEIFDMLGIDSMRVADGALVLEQRERRTEIPVSAITATAARIVTFFQRITHAMTGR